MKFAAIFLGVSGVGISGLLMQGSGLIQTLVGLGVGSSGVRSVAVAYSRQDQESLGRTIQVLRAWSWITGLASLLVCIGAASFLSRWTFGTENYAGDFIWVGFAALLQQLSNGQSAVLRGTGQIHKLASITIGSAVASVLIAIPCFVMFGIHGFAPALTGAAGFSLLGSWYYSRAIMSKLPHIGLWQAVIKGKDLVLIGVAFVGSSVAGQAASYMNGLLVRNHLGLEGNGLYQAASGITIVLVGFILGAMAQDYYPRLAGLIHRKDEACRLMHDQIEMGVLSAAPLLVFVAACAPILLKTVYSDQFLPAAATVVWLCAGCLGRVISWPLGYALLAEGTPIAILSFEIAFAAFGVLLTWLGLRLGGLEGAAAAFGLLYAVYWLVMLLAIRLRLGLVISRSLWLTILLALAAVLGAAFLGHWAGTILALVVAFASLRQVLRRLPTDHRLHSAFSNIPVLAVLLDLKPHSRT
jgi:PST family polysaccharide transporter